MVRRPTLILLVIFVVLAGVAFYLNRNPLPKDASATTPTATTAPQLLEGWNTGDITSIQLKNSDGSITLALDSQGKWTLNSTEDQTVGVGKVEQLKAQITDATVMASLEPGIGLDAIGLSTPAQVLLIQGQAGRQAQIRIGGVTPTGTGYYVQADDQVPVVISKTAVDSMLDQLKPAHLLDWTPTPGVVQPGANETPTAAVP